MKTTLTEKEWVLFVELMNKANNSDLYQMQSDLEKEIELSDKAVTSSPP